MRGARLSKRHTRRALCGEERSVESAQLSFVFAISFVLHREVSYRSNEEEACVERGWIKREV